MSQITVSNLTFAYDGSYDNIFENASFTLDTDWRLGFIGRNGRGKTTLLRLLMGQEAYQGHISASIEFCYFPYPVVDPARSAREVAAAAAAPDHEEWALCREMNLLGLEDALLDRPFSTLSNGEQTRLLLAALFLGENRFLLIDEPTSHLDDEGRRLVGNYLARKRGFILVSHDRALLDRCTDHILSLNKTSIEVQKGNFSSWQANKQLRDDFERAENEKLGREIGRLQEAARRTSGWSDAVEKTKIGGPRNSGLRPDRGFIGHKSAKMMKRAKSIESRREGAIQQKSGLLHDIEQAEALALHPLAHPQETLLWADGLTLFYGDTEVVSGVSFTLKRGDRLALRGANGSGKSTLLKAICGAAGIAHTGTLRLASGLRISVIPQDTSFLRGPLDDYARERKVDMALFKAILRKLDFARVQFEKPMESYSAGQKKKVLLAAALCDRAHLYIWDEPLNYIDVFSREQIEDVILEYQPTLLFVEHDSTFTERIATGTVDL